MDIALCIEKLLPAAKYGGSTTANTKEAYDKLRWEDERKKPTWQDILDVWAVIEKEPEVEKETIEQLIERKVKELVSDTALKKEVAG